MQVDQNLKKEIKNLLEVFAEKAHKFEWSDLINWLKKIQSALQKYPQSGIPQKYTLSKRLSQCLNPNLPQGLHFLTLSIYRYLFSRVRHEPQQLFQDLPLFLGGVFPFFQYATPDNKIIVLELLEEFFLPLGQQVLFAVPGMVCSLLPAYDEVGNVELGVRVTNIFDTFRDLKPDVMMGAIWQALLRSPSVRVGAISYLNKQPIQIVHGYLPQSELVVNAFIASLNDSQVIVRRNTLDLIKSHFPISLREDVLAKDEKTYILESMLLLLIKRDLTISRRVWEWCFNGEEDPEKEILGELEELVVSAMTQIFSLNPQDLDEALRPLYVLENLLDNEHLCDRMLIDLTVPLLVYVKHHHNNPEFSVDLIDKCYSIITDNVKNNVSVWEALDNYLEEQLVGETEKALNVVRFFLQSFPSKEQETSDPQMLPLLGTILENIHSISTDFLTATLQLTEAMVDQLEGIEQITLQGIIEYFEYFINLCSDLSQIKASDLQIASGIAITLQKYDDSDSTWCECFVNCMRCERLNVSLVGIQSIVILLVKQHPAYNGPKSFYYDDEEICLELMERLWRSMSEPAIRSKCVQLMLTMHDVKSNILHGIIGNELTGNEITMGIRRFTMFWQTTNQNNREALRDLFGNGEGTSNMLDHLDHPSAEVRHNAREWLIESLNNFSCIVDPIFNRLLQINIQRQGQDLVISNYDYKVVQNALKKLRSFVSNGAELVFAKAQQLEIPNEFQEGPLKVVDTYLDLMVEIPLIYIRTVTLDDEFKIPHQTIQAAACEFLSLVLSQKNTRLAYAAVYDILKCIQRYMSDNDQVMQLLLLNVLQVIVFNCQIETSTQQIKELINSDIFKEAFLSCVKTRDTYVRNHWISFVTESYPLVTQTIRPSDLMNVLTTLINNYCEMIITNEDKQMLFTGLTALVHETLDLTNIEKKENLRNSLLIQNYPELMRASPKVDTSIISRVFNIQPGSDSQKIISNPFIEVIDRVFQELNQILVMCIQCTSDIEDHFGLKVIGILPFKAEAQNLKIKDAKILGLLTNIMNKFPNQIVAAFIEVWISKTLELDADLTIEADKELCRLLRILISLKAPASTLLKSIFYYLNSVLYMSQPKKRNITAERELAVAHFIYSLFSYLPKEDMAMSPEQEKEAWAFIMKNFRELECSPLKAMLVWNMELMKLFLVKFPHQFMIREKKLKRDCQDFIQKCIFHVSSQALIVGEQLRYPLPPSCLAVTQSLQNIELACLLALKSSLFDIVKVLWQDEGNEKITAMLQAPSAQLMTAAISRASNLQLEIISELLSELIDSAGERLARIFKKDIVDYVTSPQFFGHMQQNEVYLEHWSNIFNRVSVYCYFGHQNIITEILGKVQTGYFVSRDSELAQRARMLKCIAYLLYSGVHDQYMNSTTLLSEKIKEFLRIDPKLVPSIFFCIRCMLLRLSPIKISELWPGLWPHVLTELMKILEKADNPENFLASLKLLEFLSIINNEEFHMYEWVFFFESGNEIEEDGFTPLVAKAANVKAPKPKALEMDFHVIEREIVITNIMVSDIQEVRSLAKGLVNYMSTIKRERTVPNWEAIHSHLKQEFLSEYL